MLEEFKRFAMRGNVIDMAVGIIVGGAFGTIAKSLVSDVLMPPIGLLLGGVDFANLFLVLKPGEPAGPYGALADAQAAGAVTMNLGLFFNAVVSFLLVAWAVFLLIRALHRIKLQEDKPPTEPSERNCPECLMTIPSQARRCGHCTAELVLATG